MLFLAYHNLRTRPARTLFTILSIALGVALIFGTRINYRALELTQAQTRQGRMAGADLEITSLMGGSLDAVLVARLAQEAGVAEAIPIYRRPEGGFSANDPAFQQPYPTLFSVTSDERRFFRGSGLMLLGTDIMRLRPPLQAGAWPQSDTAAEVLFPAAWAAQRGIEVGTTIQLITDQQRGSYRVVGLLARTGNDPQPTAWLPLGTMQAAFNAPGALSAILLKSQPGTDPDELRRRLEATLGSAYLVTSLMSAARFNLLETLIRSSLLISSVGVLLTSAFFVFNASAITMAERRRELGQLRTLGMTHHQIMQQALMEGLLVSISGSASGLLLGWALGLGVNAVVIGGIEKLPVPAVPFLWGGALASSVIGVGVTLAVSAYLGWQAGHVSPLEALRIQPQAATPPRLRRSLGIAVACVGCAVLLLGRTTTALRTTGTAPARSDLLIFMLMVGATTALLPVFLDALLGLVSATATRLQVLPTIHMVIENIRRSRARAIRTIAALTFSVMFLLTILGDLLMVRESLGLPTALHPDITLIRPSAGNGYEEAQGLQSRRVPPLSPELQADLEALKQTALVARDARADLKLPGASETTYALALDLDILRDAPSFTPSAGSWAEAERYFAQGPGVILPTLVAKRLKVQVGDTIELDTLAGRVPFTVGLVGGPTIYIPYEWAERYFRVTPEYILVQARPGTDKETLIAQAKVLARKHALLYTLDLRQAFINSWDTLFRPISRFFFSLGSLAAFISTLAVLTSLVASVLEQQQKIGTMRALGMSRAQVRGLIITEATLFGITGTLLGTLGGLVGIAFYIRSITALLEGTRTTLPASWPVPWALIGLALVLGPLLSLLGALYPADRAANVNPVEAMRAEGAVGFVPPAPHLGPTGVRGVIARLPSAAKLSAAIGLVFALTTALLVWGLVARQTRVMEENVQLLLSNRMVLTALVVRNQVVGDQTEFTPDIITTLQMQAQAQTALLQEQFQAGGSPYPFTLRYVIISNEAQQVIASDTPDLSGSEVAAAAVLAGSQPLVQLTTRQGERVFEALVPIENRVGLRLGTLHLGLGTAPVEQVRRDTLREAAGLVALAFVLAAGLTLFFARRTLAPVAAIAEVSQSVARGDLERRVPVTRWDEMGRLARAFNTMIEDLSQMQRIRDTFGRYLSPEVGEAVLSGRVSLSGERRIVTVLFCDMRGSTAFAETHAPEAVMAALNRYFELIIEAVQANGGIVKQFAGDEAMCVFGAPTSHRDDAERAVKAALRIRTALAQLNQRRAMLGEPVLEFGISLNTGEVTAGAVGSEERQEYTIIGDPVNVGARIEKLNKEYPSYKILLSDNTRLALGANAAAYILADLGEVELRGRRIPVRIWGLVGSREPASTSARDDRLFGLAQGLPAD